MIDRAREIIELFQLSRHPEGGFFREVYRSGRKGIIDTQGNERNWMTHIYFLLPENDISRFHCVKHDEIWHFYEGAPLRITEILPNSFEIRTRLIGQPGPSTTYTHCVKGNIWQSAYSQGPFSFVGCTVGPGFDFIDFEMMSDNTDVKNTVTTKYPELKRFI